MTDMDALAQEAAHQDEHLITKRRVTMTSVVARGGTYPDTHEDGSPHPLAGQPITEVHRAVDYVRPDLLDEFVADAQTRWQSVEVSEEPDAGPLGYHGPTTVPAHFKHPDAGQTAPATANSAADHLLQAAQEG